MKVNLHIHLSKDLTSLLTQLLNKENKLMSTMQDLMTEISAETVQEQKLIDTLKAAQAANDPVAIDAAIAAIKANEANMQAALAPVAAPVTPPSDPSVPFQPFTPAP